MPKHRFAFAAMVVVAIADVAWGQPTARPDRYAIENVRVGVAPDAPLQTILIHAGRIEGIVPESEPIADEIRRIDGMGRIAMPAFIDAYSRTGDAAASPMIDRDLPVDVRNDVRVDMRDANRKGIRPTYRVADGIAFTSENAEAWRKEGFGSITIAPGGELLSGLSALISTSGVAARDALVADALFANAAFAASGSGYPSTLMGYFAQLRQFFLDARHHQELLRRYAQGHPDRRPPYDRDLEAGVALVDRNHRVVCFADGNRDVDRWLRLSRELGFDLAIAGGRESWKYADQLAAAEIPVFLTLDWGEEVKDPREQKDKEGKDKEGKGETKKKSKEGSREATKDSKPESSDEETGDDADATTDVTKDAADDGRADDKEDADEASPKADETHYEYTEPFAVRLERRLAWERGRDCAIRLHEAGVAFAFGSGSGKTADLLKHVRELVAAGLPADVARHALGRGAAKLVGLDRRLGALEVGQNATLALWTEDPVVEGAQLALLMVDGQPFEFTIKEKKKKKAKGGDGAASGADVSGVWTITFRRPEADEDSEATADLTMDAAGSVTGSLTVANPMTSADMKVATTGEVSGTRLTLETTISLGDFELDVTFDAEIEGDRMTGSMTFSGSFGERTAPATATREPLRAEMETSR